MIFEAWNSPEEKDQDLGGGPPSDRRRFSRRNHHIDFIGGFRLHLNAMERNFTFTKSSLMKISELKMYLLLITILITKDGGYGYHRRQF